jgi:magnesium transporter
MKSGKSTRKNALKRLDYEFRNEAQTEFENRLPVALELITYNQSKYERHSLIPVDDLLAKCETGSIQWVNVDGLADTSLIQKIGNHFNLHYLMMEDVLNTEHRPKVDEYDDQMFLTLKMLVREEGEAIDYEHVSFVLGKDYLLSFQEKEGGDIFGVVRSRIKAENSIFRQRGPDYLLYRLVDTIVDSYYEVLEKIGYKVEQVEENISNNPSIKDFEQIQQLRKEFIYLRKVVYPLREALNKLIKNESGFIEERTVKYYSDVYDHVIHLIDSLDTYKDLTSTMMDLYMNTINYKMNEVMKLLTIITTIFIPLSFIAGIYGMNFENMPELTWDWGYYGVLGVMAAIFIAMVFYFRYKKYF